MGNKNLNGFNRPIKNHRTRRFRFINLVSLLVFHFFLIFSSQLLYGQSSNTDFERVKISEGEMLYSGLTLSPDGNTMAISTKKSTSLKLVDWKTRQVIIEYPVRQWAVGSKINFSPRGKYILVQGLKSMEFSQNIKRKIDFEIVEAAKGKSIKSFENVQEVVISSDEKYAISLDDDKVTLWGLPACNEIKSISIPSVSNAIALSPDGKMLAVSEIVNSEVLKSRFKKDKKGLKAAVKYKQRVALYDLQSDSEIKAINELYDVIYKLSFSPDGALLLVFQTPDIRIQTPNNKQTFINMIDVSKMEPLRKGFTSMSLYQPEFKISDNQKLFAINSRGNRFEEIHLYDSESGQLQKRFELGSRLFEKVDGEKLTSDSRPSFTFLPGDRSILIAIGNQLVIWNLELNQ